ncbi:PREDICTED: uncharacterized protein LOC105560063 [Vollenhovia emeryi]|uniref:uncharacterized protein LOC105560063 n=1 Tax=Vollenhovia emeryi TaxID=411798 RepID=UPI0005F3E9BE|nr:PREDICTED: uncharacterized protein LOC105560063 [Vollenhovia emeryi]
MTDDIINVNISRFITKTVPYEQIYLRKTRLSLSTSSINSGRSTRDTNPRQHHEKWINNDSLEIVNFLESLRQSGSVQTAQKARPCGTWVPRIRKRLERYTDELYEIFLYSRKKARNSRTVVEFYDRYKGYEDPS